jgi:hypothetical protein
LFAPQLPCPSTSDYHWKSQENLEILERKRARLEKIAAPLQKMGLESMDELWDDPPASPYDMTTEPIGVRWFVDWALHGSWVALYTPETLMALTSNKMNGNSRILKWRYCTI